jgi:hypothetical protein
VFIALNENSGSPSASHKIEEEVEAQAETAFQKTSEARQSRMLLAGALWLKIGELCPEGCECLLLCAETACAHNILWVD